MCGCTCDYVNVCVCVGAESADMSMWICVFVWLSECVGAHMNVCVCGGWGAVHMQTCGYVCVCVCVFMHIMVKHLPYHVLFSDDKCVCGCTYECGDMCVCVFSCI